MIWNRAFHLGRVVRRTAVAAAAFRGGSASATVEDTSLRLRLAVPRAGGASTAEAAPPPRLRKL